MRRTITYLRNSWVPEIVDCTASCFKMHLEDKRIIKFGNIKQILVLRLLVDHWGPIDKSDWKTRNDVKLLQRKDQRTQTDYVQGVVDDLTKWHAVYTASWVIHCRRTIEDLRRISRLVGKWEEDGEKEHEEEAMIGKTVAGDIILRSICPSSHATK